VPRSSSPTSTPVPLPPLINYSFYILFNYPPLSFRPAKSDKVAADIRAKGGEAISVSGDVTDPKFPEHIVKATIDAYGRLDILVNNAGYTWDGIAHRMTDKQWEVLFIYLFIYLFLIN
jgi:hypothetical protein